MCAYRVKNFQTNLCMYISEYVHTCILRRKHYFFTWYSVVEVYDQTNTDTSVNTTAGDSRDVSWVRHCGGGSGRVEGLIFRVLRYANCAPAGRTARRHVGAAVGGRASGDDFCRNVSAVFLSVGKRAECLLTCQLYGVLRYRSMSYPRLRPYVNPILRHSTVQNLVVFSLSQSIAPQHEHNVPSNS